MAEIVEKVKHEDIPKAAKFLEDEKRKRDEQEMEDVGE